MDHGRLRYQDSRLLSRAQLRFWCPRERVTSTFSTTVAQTRQLLAAILHLGNSDFTVDRGRDVDAAVVRNTDVLSVGASDNRDDLARTLYSDLFACLSEHINQRLCREDFATFIGLFDLPGSQDMISRSDSLDQFCVNFANERLKNFVQKRIFEAHVAEYQNEGISRFVPTVPYFDNTECVRLLQNKPGGLIHIMDDQARRSHKKTDHSTVEAFGKRWSNHSLFEVGAIDRSGFPTFMLTTSTARSRTLLKASWSVISMP